MAAPPEGITAIDCNIAPVLRRAEVRFAKFCQGVVLVKHDFPSSVLRTAKRSSELVSRSARKRYPGRQCVYGSRSIPSTRRQMCGAEQVSILWRSPLKQVSS
jgi:hypothetical protein